MRAVHTPHGLWLEMTGARYLNSNANVQTSFAQLP